MYIRLSDNKYPLSERDIRTENPNVSFPKPFKAEGYAVVFPSSKPTTSLLERAAEMAPALSTKGEWEQQWEVVPAFAEYTDEEGVLHTVAEQEAAELERFKNETKSQNAEKAKIKQNEVVEEYKTNSAKKALGLQVEEPDPIELENYVKNLEAEILNPSEDPAYQPPLPPGVIPLPITAMFAKVTREVGWNSVLGWKITLDISDPSYIPANIAISVYSAANCTGYLYTPGALQQDPTTGKYFAICPAGQEQGDVDYHFGLLYGAAQLSCWTFPAGQQTQIIQIYGE